MKRQILTTLVSVSLLAIALYSLNWHSLKEALLRINLWIFGCAVLLSLSQFVALAWRWWLLVAEVAPLSPQEHLRRYFSATFLNTFTPANLGGDVYRVVSLRPHAPGSAPLVVALVRERLLGLLSHFLVYLGCLGVLWMLHPRLPLWGHHVFLYAGALTLAGAAVLFLASGAVSVLLAWPAVRSRAGMATALTTVREASHLGRPADAARVLLLSCLALCLWISSVQVVAWNLGLRISWPAVGSIVVLVELVRLVPISVQGIGVREGAFAVLLSLHGAPAETGFILGTISYLALSLSIILAGVIGYLMGLPGRKPQQAS